MSKITNGTSQRIQSKKVLMTKNLSSPRRSKEKNPVRSYDYLKPIFKSETTILVAFLYRIWQSASHFSGRFSHNLGSIHSNNPPPVMQPSRNPSHGRPTRSQAPGIFSVPKEAKTHHLHESRWVKTGFSGSKCLVNPPSSMETQRGETTFMHAFDATQVDIICDFNSRSSIRVSEIQRPFVRCTLSLSKMTHG